MLVEFIRFVAVETGRFLLWSAAVAVAAVAVAAVAVLLAVGARCPPPGLVTPPTVPTADPDPLDLAPAPRATREEP